MLKLEDNPPITPGEVESVRDLVGPWWVGHTKSRFEKAFAWDLCREGIGYFLPLCERVRVSGGRKRRVMAPLFPGYVFFCGDADARYRAMTTNRLCQAIEIRDQDTFLDELARIEMALKAGAPLDPYPHAAVGRRCRIRSGPFWGTEGIVVQRNTKARIVLQVSILGQGAALEVDADLLDPID